MKSPQFGDKREIKRVYFNVLYARQAGHMESPQFGDKRETKRVYFNVLYARQAGSPTCC